MGDWEQMLRSLEAFHEHEDDDQSHMLSVFTKRIHDSNNEPSQIINTSSMN
jgi:hypothetical protein